MILELRAYDFFNDQKERQQAIWSDINKEIAYEVRDLNNCSEDATIDYELFSIYDYMDTLRLGMQLAKDGYTDIELRTKI